MRNFYGYLSSRTLAGKAPNPLQMLRLLDDADVILVAPLPFYSLFSRVGVVHAIGTFLNVVLGKSAVRQRAELTYSAIPLFAHRTQVDVPLFSPLARRTMDRRVRTGAPDSLQNL